ncbi:hypothetical protein AAVH_15902 [Aphelenchoides avenae]|nr:hypothetical protein AAVH_15902 [Aphelenchus avenae]
MMEDDGNAVFSSTTTQELEEMSVGLINVEVKMKVAEKSFIPPVVGEKGSYSKLFLKLTGDDEARVRLTAFGRVAEKANLECEEQSLVHFSGLEVVPIFRSDRHYGTVPFELKANAASACSMIIPCYRPANGMPFSRVTDVETAPEFRRLKLQGELIRDMVPYGIGLTGAALLKDASGQIQVNLLITTVAPARKHAYRAGKPVVLKGTFKKFSSTAGVVVRMTIDSDTDAELVGEPTLDKFLGSAGASGPSSVKRTTAKSAANVRLSASSSDSSGYESSPSTSAASAKRSRTEVSGRLLHDFFLDEDGTRWGMVVTPSEDNYEVRLKEVPEGAEELFLEDKEITVRGELQGYVLTVDRWADVDVEGGEEFLPTADIPILSACELRRQTVPLLCKTFAKVLNFFVNGAQASITALAQDDEGKVILKITCLEVPAPLRIYDLKGATIYATGMMESKGNKPESSIYATRLFRHPLHLGTADAEDAIATPQAGSLVPPKGKTPKPKAGKGKAGSSRSRKRNSDPLTSDDAGGSAAKAPKPTNVKIEAVDDIAKFSNALHSSVAVVTLDADNAGETAGAADSALAKSSPAPVAPVRRILPPKEPMSTRRTRRGAGAKSEDTKEQLADDPAKGSGGRDAEELSEKPADPVDLSNSQPRTALIHDNYISSESSSSEDEDS